MFIEYLQHVHLLKVLMLLLAVLASGGTLHAEYKLWWNLSCQWGGDGTWSRSVQNVGALVLVCFYVLVKVNKKNMN